MTTSPINLIDQLATVTYDQSTNVFTFTVNSTSSSSGFMEVVNGTGAQRWICATADYKTFDDSSHNVSYQGYVQDGKSLYVGLPDTVTQVTVKASTSTGASSPPSWDATYTITGIEIVVVNAAGKAEILYADANHHPELFRALRGGQASNFGVVSRGLAGGGNLAR